MDFPMFNQNPRPTLSSLVEYNHTLLAWIKSIFARCRYYTTRDTLAEALKPQNATNVTLAFNCKC